MRPLTNERAMMFLPEPEYPWKWYCRLDGQPSEYLGFSTVGSGTILHREHLKHFCISGSSSFSRGKVILLLSTLLVSETVLSIDPPQPTLRRRLRLRLVSTPLTSPNLSYGFGISKSLRV